MAFLDQDDFLILEKNIGNVKRVVNNTLIEKPLLHVDTMSIKDERGLLGIAISKKKNFYDDFFIENRNLTHKVFLYYIECNEKNLECKNRIYRYDLDIVNFSFSKFICIKVII